VRSYHPLSTVALGLFLVPAGGLGSPLPPKPTKYATDRAGVFSSAQLQGLNDRLAAFERQTSNQVLVYVDRRLPKDTSLEEMAAAAVRAWGVGRKGKDNGVVFFVFVEDRAMRIEVGYGLEGAIPDLRAKQITGEIVKPYFKKSEYAAGIEAGVRALLASVGDERNQGTGRTLTEAQSGRLAPRPPAPSPSAYPRPPTTTADASTLRLPPFVLGVGSLLGGIGFTAFLGLVTRKSPRRAIGFYFWSLLLSILAGLAILSYTSGDRLMAGLLAIPLILLGGFLLFDRIRKAARRGGGSSRSWSSWSSSSASVTDSSSSASSDSSSSDSSSSDSSSSDFSGGGGDSGGGGSSDSW
jgi:uncharacterized protein